MTTVQISIINKSPHPLPEYATAGSSGMDIRAWVNENIFLKPLDRQLIATGIYVEIPEGYEIQLRPRSGLAYKQGITCLNTPGTIDSDYRGEIKVLLINLSDEIQTIHNGDRIAQLVVAKTEKAVWLHAVQINETDRGDGGFGHTGKK
jgi:dUTP pyrophosphatase